MTFASPQARFISIEGSLNFRDFGGYSTRDGKSVIKGRLFRCGMLSDLSPSGREAFEGLDIGVICDLRREDEILQYPTPSEPPFENQRHIPIAPGTSAHLRDSFSSDADREATADERSQFMQEITREIARDHVGAYTQMLNALLEVENGFLVHCMAGKDRTGFGVAIILLALGVSETDVMEDYLLTNQASELITTIGQRMSTQGIPLSRETLEILAQVKKEYLMAALDELETQFGGIRGYLEAARISAVDQSKLKRRLLR